MELPIAGTRLRVRAWRPEESQAVFDLLGSPLTMGDMRAGRAHTLDDAETWLRRRLEQQESDGLTMWAVETLESNALVGACGVFPHDHELELAYVIDHRHRGHGYAAEAAQLVMSALASSGHVGSVYATIRPGNAASRKVAERVGLHIVDERVDERGPLLLYRE